MKLFSTAQGMAIRFAQEDARPMGRNTSGVKGIKIQDGDELVGMVVADPEADLLTVCEMDMENELRLVPIDPMSTAPNLQARSTVLKTEVERGCVTSKPLTETGKWWISYESTMMTKY